MYNILQDLQMEDEVCKSIILEIEADDDFNEPMLKKYKALKDHHARGGPDSSGNERQRMSI